MTGGTIVILGETGRNFAAGMSGGVAFVFDPQGALQSHRNDDPNLLLEAVESDDDIATLRKLLENHRDYTESKRATEILAHWELALPKFVKVISAEYKRLLSAQQDSKKTVPQGNGSHPTAAPKSPVSMPVLKN
jgi:glutamate synthase domain-containing protein 3